MIGWVGGRRDREEIVTGQLTDLLDIFLRETWAYPSLAYKRIMKRWIKQWVMRWVDGSVGSGVKGTLSCHVM